MKCDDCGYKSEKSCWIFCENKTRLTHEETGVLRKIYRHNEWYFIAYQPEGQNAFYYEKVRELGGKVGNKVRVLNYDWDENVEEHKALGHPTPFTRIEKVG